MNNWQVNDVFKEKLFVFTIFVQYRLIFAEDINLHEGNAESYIQIQSVCSEL